MVDFEVITSIPQPIHVVMAAGHPLAQAGEVRLRDCLDHRHVVPAAQYGVRHLLDLAAKRRLRALDPIMEAESFEFMRHYVLHEAAVAFQIPIGLDNAPTKGLVTRPIAARDVPPGHLLLGQLRGRSLPPASALFARQLAQALEARAAA